MAGGLARSSANANCSSWTASWQSYLSVNCRRSRSVEALQLHEFQGRGLDKNVLDILNQLILHAAHHRGQISLEIRRSGGVPAPVDYILAVRKGLLA